MVHVLVLTITIVAGCLPAGERDRLARTLHDCHNADDAPHVDDESVDDLEPVTEGPDWNYMGTALITASRLTHQAENTLRDERLYLDFDDVASDVATLEKRIRRAHSAMCAAARVDGLVLEPGDDLTTVDRKARWRRGELVDEQVAIVRDDPAPDGSTWKVEYREHGGFLATTDEAADATDPTMIGGYAPTPRSAVHVVGGYFLHRRPVVLLDPPPGPGPHPWAGGNRDRSDLAFQRHTVADLLNARGSVYDDHVAACVGVRDALAAREDLRQYLAEQAALLNATDPQLPDNGMLDVPQGVNPDHDGNAVAAHWVPSHLVVATNRPRWGKFAYRRSVPQQIADELATTADLDSFTRTLFGSPIGLIRIAAWAGPLYVVGEDGNHRVHTIRMLGLPWLAASVQYDATPPVLDLDSILLLDGGSVGRSQRDQRAADRVTLLTSLIRRGVLDADLREELPSPQLHCRWLPAPWLLRDPHTATAVNRLYEARYPGALAQLGIPADTGTDPAAWTAWLTY